MIRKQSTREKGRALFLAALMVLSVVAMSAAFSGLALARNAGNDEVVSGETVFQGEEVDFVGSLDGKTLFGTTGDAEGIQLEEGIIPEDQPQGIYTEDGQALASQDNLRVSRPRISSLDIDIFSGGTDSGGDADGGSVSTASANDLRVRAKFNFQQAETLEVSVEDENGNDITDEVLNDTDKFIETTNGNVSFDLSDQDAGEYTFTVEGDDDLDFGDAVRSTTVTLTTQQNVRVDFDQDEAVQGDNVGYTVSGGTDGELYIVAIERSDFRSGISVNQAVRIFRNVEDTEERGIADDSNVNGTQGNHPFGGNPNNADIAYAILEMDGTTAVGQVNTQFLDDSTIDIDVYGPITDTDNGTVVSGLSSLDDDSLSVSEGEVQLDSVSPYIIGSEVDVTGTAESANEVLIYVRDQGDWEPAEDSQGNVAPLRISVDADDTFEEEDVVLSSRFDALRQEGTYRIGVIDASDVSNASAELGTSAFSSGSSHSTSIRTVAGELSAQFTTINGQVNQDIDNSLDVEGTATGQSEVVLAFVDNRGNTNARTVTVDSDGSFDEEDLDLSNAGLTKGTVSAHVISLGRDGDVGNGDLPNADPASSAQDLVDYINNNVTAGSPNGEQVRDRILDQTVDDTASDDLIVTQSFRYTDSSSTIQSVYPEGNKMSGVNPIIPGETMIIEGQTNLRPSDNTITVELLDDSGESVILEDTDEWGSDGVWSVGIDTTDLETGTYVIESDDGTNTDQAEVELVDEREDPSDGGPDESELELLRTEISTLTDRVEELESDREELRSERDELQSQVEDLQSERDDLQSQLSERDQQIEDLQAQIDELEEQPGFGLVVALVALLAAAGLAVRRRN